MSKDFLCQASDGNSGEDGIACGSSIEPRGEAEELIAWAAHTIRTIKDRCCGERHPYWSTPEAVSRSRAYIADHCDAVLPRLEATPTQAQLEEPGTGDEVDAGNKSASLTQIARGIMNSLPAGALRRYAELGDGQELFAAIASALLTVQKQEREQATRWRNDCGILLAQLDYLSEATGETLDCQDAGLVEQIRTDYAASIRQGDDNAG